MPPPKDKWVRRFILTETDRHKRGFTIYKVTSIMFLKSSSEVMSKLSVWKRYSDFRQLHAVLSTLYSSLRIKEQFPVLPKSRFFGRFRTEVIEERKECALRLFNFIAKHSVLYTSDTFVKFFESSHLDETLTDCSKSISSDTSEDDRGFVAENPDRHQLPLRHSQALAKEFRKSICTEKAKPTVPSNDFKTLTYKKENISTINENERNRNSNNYHENLPNGIVLVEESTGIHDGSDLPKAGNGSAQYILIAAAHMSAAFRHETIAEYEEAFTQYKLGISNLMNGFETDSNVERKNTIQGKIRKYLQRAEKLYNRHLNCNISVFSKPVSELGNYNVLELMDSVMLVEDRLRGFTRVIKTIEMSEGSNVNIGNYILRGKVPYMVQLYACIQTDSTVFLVLQYIRKGTLWDFIKSHYKPNKESVLSEKGHTRSVSCDAVILPTCENDCNNFLYLKTEERVGSLKSNRVESKLTNFKNTTEIKCSDKSFYKQRIEPDPNRNNVHTTELLAKAQRLLQSVNATLQKSDPINTRLNKSQHDTENSMTSFKLSDPPKLLVEEPDENYNNFQNLKLGKDLNSCRCNVSKSSDVDTFKFQLSAMTEGENIKYKCQSAAQSTVSKKLETKTESKCIENEQKALWQVSEDILQLWAAQILVALESLHQQDAIVADLSPEKILINDDGSTVMTYIAPRRDLDLLRFKEPYSSPELCVSASPIMTTAVDIWSFGVLLYELFTGFKFQSKHCGEFNSYSSINIPDGLSEDAKSLLLGILKYKANERLTIPDIKRHSFFAGVNWFKLLNS